MRHLDIVLAYVHSFIYIENTLLAAQDIKIGITRNFGHLYDLIG